VTQEPRTLPQLLADSVEAHAARTALITLDERTNRVLNIIKAKFGHRNKSEAIGWLIERYESELLEPELKPEFVKRMQKRAMEPTVEVDDLGEQFGIDCVLFHPDQEAESHTSRQASVRVRAAPA